MKKTIYFFIAASFILYFGCNKQFQEETIKEAAKIESIKGNRVLKTETQNNSAEYDIIDEFYPQDHELQTLVTSFNLELENYYANESIYENRTIEVAKWLLEAYLNTNFDFIEHPLKNVEKDTLSIEIEKDLMGLAIGESIIESYFLIKNEINSEISDSKKLYYIDIYGLQENENNFELMAVLAFGTFSVNHTWTNTLNPINYSTCG